MNRTILTLLISLVSWVLTTSLWAQRYTPVIDTYIAQNTSTTSYGTSSTLLVRASASFNRVTFLEFNIGDFSQQITNAELSLYLSAITNTGTETVDVFEVTSGTITNTITWSGFNTAYTLAADRITSLDIASSYRGWCKFQIKDLVNTVAAKPGTDKKIKLAIKARTSALLLTFQSSETSNPDYSPSLILNNNADTIGVNGPSTIIMPTLFSDNMVLQRDKPIKVWGEVLPNEPVVITFDGQNYNTQCDSNGKFTTLLPSKSVSQQIYTMKIKANNDSLSYSNLVMGDVYICGGQSNMAFKVTSVKADQLADAKADSNYPNLRFFQVAQIVSGGALLNTTDKPWESAVSSRVVDWSAVAFFVGRDIHKYLNVPIGLINISQGGAPSDAFISPEAYANDPVLNAAKRPNGTGIYSYYQSPSSLYNSMVSKVVGFPVKAVLWYQAEGNAVYWTNFKTIFKGLIKDWRTQWNEPTLPWIFVQLPTYEVTTDPTLMTWAETRDIQLQVWKEDPNTGMAVTMDLGNPADLHPTDKYNVAKRMIPIVKALVYGEEITHKSTVYKSHKVISSEIFVTFDNLGGGLKAVKDITEFEIAAADKVYKAAVATIMPDNSIKLSNATIPNPIFVRYAFRNNSTISIFTSDEFPLPLSPFRAEFSAPIVDPPVDLSEIAFDKINNAFASSSDTEMLPLYAINGAGLIGDAHEASTTSKAWHSNDIPFPHYFKIELKSPHEVAATRIWNLNWTSTYLNRGVKDIEIYGSESTSAMQDISFNHSEWKKVMTYTMSQATGDTTYKGELLNFPTAQKNVKWIGINILNSYNSSNGYTGLSEIKLYSQGTPTQLQPVFKKKIAQILVQDNALHIQPLIEGATVFALYSIHGVKMFTDTLNRSTYTYSTISLPKGYYLLSISNGEIIENIKILI